MPNPKDTLELRARKLVEVIADIDFKQYDDYFGWSLGGDGDNGEILVEELTKALENESNSTRHYPGCHKVHIECANKAIDEARKIIEYWESNVGGLDEANWLERCGRSE